MITHLNKKNFYLPVQCMPAWKMDIKPYMMMMMLQNGNRITASQTTFAVASPSGETIAEQPGSTQNITLKVPLNDLIYLTQGRKPM